MHAFTHACIRLTAPWQELHAPLLQSGIDKMHQKARCSFASIHTYTHANMHTSIHRMCAHKCAYTYISKSK